MTDDRVVAQDISARLLQLEAQQIGHFRRAMFLLVYFTVAFACLAWEWDTHVNRVFEFLPIATVVVICVWVACVCKHTRELSRLRKLATSNPNAVPDSDGNEAHQQEPAANI